MVLRRQSLLTAHELGHVMGFGHNFASSINDRASVMEYPTPRVKVTRRQLDLSEAFDGATGATTTSWRATPTPSSRRRRRRRGSKRSSRDAREEHPLRARHRSALVVVRRPRHADRVPARDHGGAQDHARRYGPGILKPGEPIGALRDMRLWMTYLHHRWAIEAGLGYVGGMYHNIVVKGEDAARPKSCRPRCSATCSAC